jgi:hypothetical protein
MKFLCLVYLAEKHLHAVPDSDCMAYGDCSIEVRAVREPSAE